MIWPLLLLSISFLLSINGFKLHEHLTKEEIQSVFHCDHDAVHKLDYEVIKVFHEENKETSKVIHSKPKPIIRLLAFDRNYTLYLEENDSVLLGAKTPLFLANVNNTDIKYTKMKYPLPANFKLYHDVDNRASVTVHKASDNKVHVDGIVGDNLVIRPLPARVHDEVLPKDLSIANEQVDFYDYNPLQQTAHVAYRLSTHSSNIPPFNPIENQLNRRPTRSPLRSSETTRRSTYQRPLVTQSSLTSRRVASVEIVYPQLLITSDYQTYTIHGSNIEAVSKYMAAFWNAVDLRFREVNNPKIRLNIAGLIIPQSADAASYMEQHIVRPNVVENVKTLVEIRSYFSKQKRFPKNMYDVVVAITHRNLGKDKGGEFIDTVTGTAYRGEACQTENGYAAALVRDKGGYVGITTAAHEVAHTFDARHDGPDTNELPEGPCTDGYLMSYHRRDRRGLQWSPCSLASMRTFFTSDKAQCLRNKPDVGKPYPKVLPGKLLSRDEQCRRTLGMVSDKKREHDCTTLWCATYKANGPPVTRTQHRPPAEGSYCAKGGICLDGLCVKDPETRY